MDDSFPQWGTSPYIDLTLKGTVRLRDLLRHLYVLIPVFDMQKHYWMGTSEVEKLLRNGEGWLESHPEKNFITGRYFRRNKQMAKEALERLDALVVSETESEEETDENGEVIVQAEKVVRLNDARMEAVLNAIKQSGAKNIVDMGCGSGQLLRLLIKEGGFTRLAGMDVSPAKPLEFIPERENVFVQPALKCRGKEYLRIIYGPEYTDQIHRLKKRSGSKKAKLAQQEFALGIEGLERFTRGDSLRRVHECVFSILALESEPVDPRL